MINLIDNSNFKQVNDIDMLYKVFLLFSSTSAVGTVDAVISDLNDKLKQAVDLRIYKSPEFSLQTFDFAKVYNRSYHLTIHNNMPMTYFKVKA